jgi:uncharacterized SAM-binding protein YcdF (DUF218 family)
VARGRRRGRRILGLVGALVVVLLLVLAGTAARVVAAGRSDDAPADDPPSGSRRTADAILVLGAAQFDGRPQEYLAARLDHARDLYRAGTATRVLTLGGRQPGDRFTEADAGQRYLVQHGVPADRIVRVGQGNDTLVSIRAAARLMRDRGWDSAVIVTDPWHELRSTTMLRDQGITAYGSPTTRGPSVAGAGVPVRYVGRETVAYLAYVVRRTLS